jgi:hypothetical protein
LATWDIEDLPSSEEEDQRGNSATAAINVRYMFVLFSSVSLFAPLVQI